MKKKEQPEIPSSKEKQNQPNEYLRYTGLAFQLAATIGLFTYGGYWLDNRYMGGQPVFLIAMLLLGTFAALYHLYKSLPK